MHNPDDHLTQPPFPSAQDCLAALSWFSQVLAATEPLSGNLEKVLESVLTVLHSERGFLALLDPATGALHQSTALRLEGDQYQPWDTEINQQVVQEVLAAGKRLSLSKPPAGQNNLGEGLPGHVLCAPLLAGGRITGALSVNRIDQPGGFSVQDLKLLNVLAAHLALALEYERLSLSVRQVTENKARFTSMVTHELRIPMTSIRGYTDLLLHGVVGPLNPQQQDFLSVIRSNVDRMATLVSDLADIARLESGRLKLSTAPVPLFRSVEETLNILRPKIEEKKQNLTVEISPNIPPVTADPARLVQVLANLLSNACKYTPPGENIAIRACQDGDHLRVEVSDTGIGISVEDQAHLFSQFFRSEDPAVRQEVGWGLGLHVAARLVEMMGGAIGFKSRLGEGSTFWFTLPV
jgi:signal transduction histidine kinase